MNGKTWLRFDKHDIGMMFENNCQNVINFYSPRYSRLEVDITKVIWYNYQRGTKKMILTNFLVTTVIIAPAGFLAPEGQKPEEAP